MAYQPMLLKTDRLMITEFDEAMATAVHLNSLDADNRRFVPDEVFETVKSALATIRWLRASYANAAGPFVYPLLLPSGENIGYVQAVSLGKGWEIGYHIAKAYTGQGYATEAVTAFLPEIMGRLGITVMHGLTLFENHASKRVLEKCGFALDYAGPGPYQGAERRICRYLYRA